MTANAATLTSEAPQASPDDASSPLVATVPEAGPPKKYLVGVLYYGAIDREHDRCVKALHDHPLVHDVLELTGCPYIDIGRSIIATSVLDNPDIGGVLFIDHDMVFEAKEAIACIESAMEADATVGAAYSMRKPGHIIGGVDGSKLAMGEKVVFFEGGKRRAANYLGMGMTAISRNVLVRLVAESERVYAEQQSLLAELRGLLSRVTAAVSPEGTPLDPTRGSALLELLSLHLRDPDLPRLSSGISNAPVVPFFSLVQRKGYYYGEDVSFCLRSHLANVPVMLDTRIRVYHKGSYCYGLEDVGMEVPYCTRLEVVDVKEPKAAPALFSKDESVRDALRQAFPGQAIPLTFDPTASSAAPSAVEASA